jgi:hypothetical protein
MAGRYHVRTKAIAGTQQWTKLLASDDPRHT